MSVDATCINAVNGLQEKNIKLRKMILISLTFGLFQFIMPLIGYGIGFSLKQYIESYIPWIAFVLLVALGIKSFIDWLKDFKKKDSEKEKEHVIKPLTILYQGVATSIDALCLGFVFLEYTIYQALLAFMVVGITTFTLSFLSILFAKQIASKLEKWASLIAAIVFIALGIKILLEGIL